MTRPDPGSDRAFKCEIESALVRRNPLYCYRSTAFRTSPHSLQDDEIVANYFLSCKETTGSGFCAANGIYRYDYVNNDPTDPARNTTCLSIFSNATSPAHVAPITYADVLDRENGVSVRPATLFQAPNDCREKPYYLGAKASPTGKSLTLINAVVGGPTLVAAHVIGTGEKGVVTMTMVLTAVSDFLATLDLQDGTMYIKAGTVLVASSDGYLGHSGNASGLLQPSESSNPHIRASAAFLGAGLGNSSAHDVRLLGVKYFMDTQVVQYDDLEFTIVMLVPRSAIMHDIDRKSRLTIAIIVSGTAGIGVIGCFFAILLTSPVSEEIKLKRELILQLEATQKAEARNETKSRFLANMRWARFHSVWFQAPVSRSVRLYLSMSALVLFSLEACGRQTSYGLWKQ
jgi:hypothetical protein